MQPGSKNSSNNWADFSTPSPPARSAFCPARPVVQLLFQSCQTSCKILPNGGTLAGCNTRLAASYFICAFMRMHGGRPWKRRKPFRKCKSSVQRNNGFVSRNGSNVLLERTSTCAKAFGRPRHFERLIIKATRPLVKSVAFQKTI